MEYLIKIAEWIIGLVRQKNGLLEKELELASARCREAVKEKERLDILKQDLEDRILHTKIVTRNLERKLKELNDDYDRSIAQGLIDVSFIKESVANIEDMEVFKRLGGK